jgi:hypothetical protein
VLHYISYGLQHQRNTKEDQMTNSHDAKRIADAFRKISTAAMAINEVLANNDRLNETVPTNWPLNLSADEFAAECAGMADHYDAIAELALDYDRKYGNRV